MTRIRTTVAVLPLAATLLLSAQALVVDTGPERAGRVHSDEDPDAAARVPAGIAADGMRRPPATGWP
jgi:polar amino acid transport system substrate-binding protein